MNSEIIENKEQKKQIAQRAMAEEEVLAGLMNRKSILLQSNEKVDKNEIVSSAANKAGLKLAEIEISNIFKELPERQKQEDLIKYLEKKNYDAIRINCNPEEDVATFARIAQQLNLILIACITDQKDSSMKLNTCIFDSARRMVPLLEGKYPINFAELDFAERKNKAVGNIHEMKKMYDATYDVPLKEHSVRSFDMK